jgi:hypothetical protein
MGFVEKALNLDAMAVTADLSLLDCDLLGHLLTLNAGESGIHGVYGL